MPVLDDALQGTGVVQYGPLSKTLYAYLSNLTTCHIDSSATVAFMCTLLASLRISVTFHSFYSHVRTHESISQVLGCICYKWYDLRTLEMHTMYEARRLEETSFYVQAVAH